jgi:predicted nucleotidyltransferase
MFDRPHHQRIARVLESLDGAVLRDHQCLFGGGTAIALRYGEYRESVDIDLLVSARDRYRELRHAMTGADGLTAILRPAVVLEQTSELRADQYGIRTWLSVDGQSIRLEIVLEGRINLEAPGPTDVVCGIATLTPLDMAASKLLANSDRWMEDGVFSRDLIDLAMMRANPQLLRAAAAKAEGAYGPAVLRDLHRAIDRIQARTGWLERVMTAMQMDAPPALVWQRIRALRRALPWAEPEQRPA